MTVSARRVSPWKTGTGNRMSVIERLPRVVPRVRSLTVIPTSSPRVKMLLTTRAPCWVVRANSSSRCRVWVFMVRQVKRTLSISVTVRPYGWR